MDTHHVIQITVKQLFGVSNIYHKIETFSQFKEEMVIFLFINITILKIEVFWI